MVATVRALRKTRGRAQRWWRVVPLDSAYTEENLPLLRAGMANLKAHLDIAAGFGVPVVVAINRFPTDSEHELELVQQSAMEGGACPRSRLSTTPGVARGTASLPRQWSRRAVGTTQFDFLYPSTARSRTRSRPSPPRSMGRVGRVHAAGRTQIADFERSGFGYLPICMAKTHLSISDDPSRKGALRDMSSPFVR